MRLNLTDNLQLRKINNDDQHLLFEIYSSTRTDEINNCTGWSETEKKSFLEQQFNAQHTYYQQVYINADFWIIEKNKKTIGRLYLDTNFENRVVRIIDITLLPAFRNQGIGRQILLDIFTMANALNRKLTIHVECFSPALRLYKRLGFEIVDTTNSVYYLMEKKLLEPVA